MAFKSAVVGRCMAVVVIMAAGASHADPPDCGPPVPNFAYGNAGFAAGYSRWVHGLPSSPPSCAAPRPACGPCWRPCLPRICPPMPCHSPCHIWSSPTCGWGWHGISFDASFGYGCVPMTSSAPLARPVRPLAMVDHGRPLRMSNADARRRARNALDAGDRHLRDAFADRRKLAAALAAYRRAGDIAPDMTEPFVRQAIVLVALDREEAAARAVDSIAAIDPRLSATVADDGMLALREIWDGSERIDGVAPDPAFTWIADRWSGRWHPEQAQLAAGVPTNNR